MAILAMMGMGVPGWIPEVLFWLSFTMPAALGVGLVWAIMRRETSKRPGIGQWVRIGIAAPLSVLALGWLGCTVYAPKEPVRTELRSPEMMPIVYSENYLVHVMGIEKMFVFDVNKYGEIRDELVRQGLRGREDFLVPETVTPEQLRLVHTERYLAEIREPGKAAGYLEFPQVAAIPGPVYRARGLAAFEWASGGTILTARKALEYGVAVNLAGGYAHASADEGGGFCLIADVPIAIRVLQQEGKVERVMIIDTDAHHGQGNAKVFAGDDTVRVVDVYEEDIYPSVKEKVWRNVPFEAGVTEEGYMRLLEQNIGPALDEHKPDLVMFVMGSDIYEGDPLTETRIPKEGVLKRDLYVVEECRKRNIPVAMTLSGGYSEESWRIHADSIAALARKYDKVQQERGAHDKKGR